MSATPLPRASGPIEPDTYGFQWALVGLLLVGIGVFQWHHRQVQSTSLYQPPRMTTAARVPWFLVLRMPPITAQYESGIDTMRVRYGQWLDALSQAGFVPMKLSDVQAQLDSGRGVPEKTVVLLFDPGFRRTYQLVAPILAQHGWPAVWLSNDAAMRSGHREYVTYHTADAMIRSGWWDVGLTRPDGTFVLKSSDHGTRTVSGPNGSRAWSAVAGGVALNASPVGSALNRLNIISDWTAPDVLNRVRAEVPISRGMSLGQAPVQNLAWGVMVENASDPEAVMNLQTLPYKRGLVLDWFGTAGLSDLDLEGQADSFVGDVCLRLRWDEARGDGITVLISRDQWAVLELSGSHLVRKSLFERSASRFKVSLALQGNQLSVSMDGAAPVIVPLTTATAPGRGLFQLFIVDKFRGTARAAGLRLRLTPHPSR